MRTPLVASSLLPLLAVIACQHGDRARTQGGEYGGTMVIAVIGDADALLPPITVNATSYEVDGLVFENLARPGATLDPIGDQGWTGQLADSWTWGRDSLTIGFHIDSAARWHDGVPVRSSDVKFTVELYKNPKVGSFVAPLLANIDSVSTPDSAIAVFWFKKRYPGQFYDAAYQMRILPRHVLAGADLAQLQSSPFARHPIGSGPYRFVNWVPRQTIELQADTSYHRGRPRLERLIWSIAPDPNASLVRVLSGDADFLEFVNPPDIPRVAKTPNVKLVAYPSMAYGYLLFNERDPNDQSRPNALFADRSLRRALTMAIDRRRVTRSVFDSLGSVAYGPYTRALPYFDSTVAELPYSPDSARHLLDALGWHAGPDGIRVKNGTPLRFSMLVPTSSAVRMQTAVLLQAMFQDVGVKADIETADMGTVRQRSEARQFQTVIEAMQSDGNPSSILQGWGVDAAKAKDGGNAGSYENPRFDALVDTAIAQFDAARAKSYYFRAHSLLNEDAPAIWLWEPSTVAAVQKRIHPVDMRADEWFANISQWYIPSAERMPRDQIRFAEAQR
ncbi:MAG TPA: peptide ABC transporter substrate-binding protein [Gemmatimonadaceae bacterium]|nr:peptide ABC transporter substrate-binding protein [Gemmatimonadaceae bacterium]